MLIGLADMSETAWRQRLRKASREGGDSRCDAGAAVDDDRRGMGCGSQRYDGPRRIGDGEEIASFSAGAEELVTTEKRGKPLHRAIDIRVRSIQADLPT